jgi:hypothetical protein
MALKVICCEWLCSPHIAHHNTGVLPPFDIVASESEGGGKVTIAEIDLYGDYTVEDPTHHSDTVLRFLSFDGFNVSSPNLLHYFILLNIMHRGPSCLAIES